MKKKDKQFVCQGCGNITTKWFGKCNNCDLWDSIVLNELEATSAEGKEVEIFKSTEEINEKLSQGYKTNIEEIDRVFGGNIHAASVALIGGEPGIGKSTLILQIASLIQQEALYVSGEESVAQVISRAKRLGIASEKLYIMHSNELRDIIKTVHTKKNLKLLIIDSIQTIHIESIPSYAGSINQIKMCTSELINLAKKQSIILFIIGHITKDGQIAGPKLLEHMVDTVLYFEGENLTQLRILRTIKNRFGSVQEIGVFEMTAQGLKSVSNPSLLFLSNSTAASSIGSSVYAGIEGSRSLLIEIQALVIKTYMNIPRRAVVGWDNNRLSMIVAVLTSKCSLTFDNQEVYLNIAGGIKIQETAADLAVSAALISALMQKPLPPKTIIFGEVSLSGEVRKVPLSNLRLKEAIKLGFTNAIVPDGTINIKEINITYIKNIIELKNII